MVSSERWGSQPVSWSVVLNPTTIAPELMTSATKRVGSVVVVVVVVVVVLVSKEHSAIAAAGLIVTRRVVPHVAAEGLTASKVHQQAPGGQALGVVRSAGAVAAVG